MTKFLNKSPFDWISGSQVPAFSGSGGQFGPCHAEESFVMEITDYLLSRQLMKTVSVLLLEVLW